MVVFNWRISFSIHVSSSGWSAVLWQSLRGFHILSLSPSTSPTLSLSFCLSLLPLKLNMTLKSQATYAVHTSWLARRDTVVDSHYCDVMRTSRCWTLLRQRSERKPLTTSVSLEGHCTFLEPMATFTFKREREKKFVKNTPQSSSVLTRWGPPGEHLAADRFKAVLQDFTDSVAKSVMR